MPTALADRLRADSVIDDLTHKRFTELWGSEMRLEAVHTLLHSWLMADRAGVRSSSQLRTFTPNPGGDRTLQPSTFRLDNFDTIIMGEQTEVRDFLVQGFMTGFSLDRSDEGSWSPVEHKNGQLTPEAADLLQRGIDDDLARGFLCPRQEEDGEWQCWPLFVVEKMSNGLPTGKLRRISHYSMESEDVPSINSQIDASIAKIEYQTTTRLQSQILDLYIYAEEILRTFFSCLKKSSIKIFPVRTVKCLKILRKMSIKVFKKV